MNNETNTNLQRNRVNYCCSILVHSLSLRACIVTLLGFLTTATGCSMLGLDSNDKKDAKKSLEKAVNDSTPRTSLDENESQRGIKVLGGGLMLGSADNLAFDEQTFAQILQEQMASSKWGCVEFLLQTYPDVAMSLLLYGPSQSISNEELLQIAKTMDAIWPEKLTAASSNMELSPKSWATYLRELSEFGNSKTESLAALRGRFLDNLSNNQCKEALKLDLVRQTAKSSSDIAKIEAYRLHANAFLLSGDYASSIQQIQMALVVANDGFPVQRSRLHLLLAEALRHQNEKEKWAEAWREAVTVESLAMLERGFHDPSFWKQAAFQRPVNQDWPPQVMENFLVVLKQYGLSFPTTANDDSAREAIVWAVIGTQSLNRHESQNAILAFKKSEAMATNLNLKNELLLKQALAMIDAGQAGPASPVLYRLTSLPGTVANRSRAVLGAMKLQHGSLNQGLNLLQASIQDTSEWPTEERLRAESDYALALLIAGKEKEGLELQDKTFGEFANLQMFNHAAQCLANQIRYFEAKQLTPQHTAAIDKLNTYEATSKFR